MRDLGGELLYNINRLLLLGAFIGSVLARKNISNKVLVTINK
jgi:hypothetical protein